MSASERDDASGTVPDQLVGRVPPPPPSPKLLAALGEMKPVRTRSRWGAFLVVLVLGAAWPVYTLLDYPLRRDLVALPPLWVGIGLLLWGAAFVFSLAGALVPAHQQVLPSAARAARASAIAMGVLFLFTAMWTAEAPGVSLRPEDIGQTLLQSCVGCGKYILKVGAIFLLLGYLVLRRVLPAGGRSVGLALGAAGGAMGGLALHLLCPIATTGHVLLSHVGAMILAAAAGGLIVPALLGR